jgi:GDP-L-fucose synthase
MTNKRILVTGGHGFLGSRVVLQLNASNAGTVFAPTHSEYDLLVTDEAIEMVAETAPDIVIHLAAEVGGIGANQARPWWLWANNLTMGLNVLQACKLERELGFLEKVIFVGTVCSYPRNCQPPFRESELFAGYPEETNAPYGIAKRCLGVGLDALCRETGLAGAYLLPTNLYGPCDNFSLATGHVIPAMIRRFVEAVEAGENEVTLWGTGQATREFLHVDDAAAAIVAATNRVTDPYPINLGGAGEVSIESLATMVAKACGYTGLIRWDTSKPDGQPRRAVDSSRAASALGWHPDHRLEEGIRQTVEWFRVNYCKESKHEGQASKH